jgi:hypothetical protein
MNFMKQYSNQQPTTITQFRKCPELDSLVNTAWNFCATALWSNLIFSNKEIGEAKKQMRFYFSRSGNPKTAYTIFYQRVLLARQYLNNANGRFIPLPSIWLNPENDKGFAGTNQWFQKLNDARQSLPHYKIELKALAEAIWELNQEPTQSNFCYWKNYFIERRAPGLLSLFLNTVANQQFQIQ